MTDGEKERIKLRATWLNGISIATFAVGGLAPAIQFLLNSQVALQTGGRLSLATISCFLLSIILHLAASTTLRRLDQ